MTEWKPGDRCSIKSSVAAAVVMALVGSDRALIGYRYSDSDGGFLSVCFITELCLPIPSRSEDMWAELEAFIAETPVVIA